MKIYYKYLLLTYLKPLETDNDPKTIQYLGLGILIHTESICVSFDLIINVTDTGSSDFLST
jgi:hypothetical protein